MKKMNVRLPDHHLLNKIEAEARARRIPKAAVVREWLSLPTGAPNRSSTRSVGSARDLPGDLGARKNEHLRRK